MTTKNYTYTTALISNNAKMDELICVARGVCDDIKHHGLLDPLTGPRAAITNTYQPFHNLIRDNYAGALVYFSGYVDKSCLGELRQALNQKTLIDIGCISDEEFSLLADFAVKGFTRWCTHLNCQTSLFYVPDNLKELAERKINFNFIKTMARHQGAAEDYIHKFLAHCYLLYLRDKTEITLNIQEDSNTRVLVKAQAAGKINSTLMNFTINPREITYSNAEGRVVNLLVGPHTVKLDAKIPNLANLLVNHL
jgi:hypothetical protein